MDESGPSLADHPALAGVSLQDLGKSELWALFAALTDPDGVPAGVADPAAREQLRRYNVGAWAYDAAECASRRVRLEEALEIVTIPGVHEMPEAPPDGEP